MKKKLIPILAFCLFSTGCGLLRELIGVTIPNTVNKTEAMIDDAISKITSQSESWQSTLQKLESKLVEDAQSTVRNEVQNLASRTVAAAGAEIRCNVDFLGNRVVQELNRIKARFLGKPIPERFPALCQVIPSALDLNLPPQRRNQIDIAGYDFDNQPGLKLYHVVGNQKIDVTLSLNRLTHYHMVINLGSTGIVLTPNSNKLLLEFNNQEIASITVLQPQIPDCIVEEVTFESPNSITFIPPHTRGDREYDGHGPKVNCKVSAEIFGNTVRARVDMKAEETVSDWTTAEGHDYFTLYTAPSNRKILAITSDTFSEKNYTDSNHADDVIKGAVAICPPIVHLVCEVGHEQIPSFG